MPRTTPRPPVSPPDFFERHGALLVVITAIIASIAGIANEFVQDDLRLIQTNARVHGLGALGEILTSPYWPPPWHQELYRPVVTIGHALQYTLGAGGPLLFRLVSYLLYALAALGVLALARRVLPVGLAVGVALLFAAHPVHVEAVALAVGQGELLVAIAGLGLTVRYLDRRRAGGMTPRDWLGFAAVYFIATMCKEQGLLLPALLAAAELTLVTGPARQKLRAVAPGFALLAGVALLSIFLRRLVLGGQFTGVFISEALQGLTFGERVLTMLSFVPEWTRLLVWPLRLQADYAPQELVASSGFGAREALGLGIILLSLAGAWLCRRRAPLVTFAVAWLAVTLAPVSNLVPTGILLAERTLFLPSVGFLLAIGGLIAMAVPDLRAWRRELLVGGAVLLALGLLRSAERQRVWRNEAFFSVRGVQDAPMSYRAQRAYGEVLFMLGRNDLALAAYARAVELAPAGHAWRVHNDLARRWRAMGETEREIEELQRSLSGAPEQQDTRGYLIAAYLLLGKYREAAAEIEAALVRGAQPETYRNLRRLADSAAAAGAPPGSIRVRPVTEPRP